MSDYQEKAIRWNGLRLARNTKPEPKVLMVFAVVDENGRTPKLLDVAGKSISLEALVPKEHLDEERRERLLKMLRSF
ncbi:hypothetical protein GN244_ATG14216 [Phytophthora infestans]|uniref:Uncharacterized protein n=1 Tax=Phytophthora infestans TaxID=4787 RepID=A0A833SWL4_PHYIN|nr:hypothetical protein GN244_ATG14216 [Phytophthora infestans]KAF4135221.1 hypothetical protein GN958_ATG15583 [Phytophthora infestans]